MSAHKTSTIAVQYKMFSTQMSKQLVYYYYLAEGPGLIQSCSRQFVDLSSSLNALDKASCILDEAT